MEEHKRTMWEMKVIALRLDDYKIFFKALWNEKYFYIAIAFLSLLFYVIIYLMHGSKSFVYGFLWLMFVIFVGSFIIHFLSLYLNTINSINTECWGVSVAPIVSYIFCFKFFSLVSFDKTFIIGASIILSWIFTKFILWICIDTKR